MIEVTNRLRKLLEEGPHTLVSIPLLQPRIDFWSKRVNWGIYPDYPHMLVVE